MSADDISLDPTQLDRLAAAPGSAEHLQKVFIAVRDERLSLAFVPQSGRGIGRMLDKIRMPALVIIADDTDRTLGPAGFDQGPIRRLLRTAHYVAVMAGAPVPEMYEAGCRHAVETPCLVVLIETRVEQETAWMDLASKVNPKAALLLASPSAGSR